MWLLYFLFLLCLGIMLGIMRTPLIKFTKLLVTLTTGILSIRSSEYNVCIFYQSTKFSLDGLWLEKSSSNGYMVVEALSGTFAFHLILVLRVLIFALAMAMQVYSCEMTVAHYAVWSKSEHLRSPYLRKSFHKPHGFYCYTI